MKVLVACEFSGRVRDAFIKKGHDAISCDLIDTDTPGPHYKGDVRDILGNGWDLMIAHPPCTYLARSGIHWNKRRPERAKKTEEALEFVKLLLDAPINMIALENPIGVISTRIKMYSQVIHPWKFGHPEQKPTCLWLKNLPRLKSTNIIPMKDIDHTAIGRASMVRDRRRERSITFQGIAEAMANQWG